MKNRLLLSSLLMGAIVNLGIYAQENCTEVLFPGYNLNSNCDFEKGNLDGYSGWGNKIVVSSTDTSGEVYCGNYSAKVWGINAGSIDFTYQFKQNTNYKVRAMVYVKSGTQFQFGIIGFGDYIQIPRNNKWELIEFEFNPGNNNFTGLYFNNYGRSGDVGFIDNWEIYEMPNINELSSLVKIIDNNIDNEETGHQDFISLLTSTKELLADESFNSPKNNSKVITLISDLKNGFKNYISDTSTPDSPKDMSWAVVNPKMDGTSGWLSTCVASNKQIINNSNSNNINVYEHWNKSTFTGKFYQTIEDLPIGVYELKAAIFGKNQSTTKCGEGLFLYGNNESTNIKNYNIAYQTVSNILVTDGKLEFGWNATESTNNWIASGDYKLSYLGTGLETALLNLVTDKINELNSLKDMKMQLVEKNKLEESLNNANNAISEEPVVWENLNSALESMKAVQTTVTISINAYQSLQQNIDKANQLYADGTGNDADQLKNIIEASEVIVNNLSVELSDLYEQVVILEKAQLSFNIANATGSAPKVTTNTNYARGSSKIFGRCTVSGATNILETGFCWSTEPNPTIIDNRSTKYYDHNGKIYVIENLEPSTVYYVRPYSLTKTYAVGYGDVLKVITIPRGNIGYTLTQSVTNAEGHNERITAAIISAVEYWNDLTNITGHNLWVQHHAGTPTAEASYGGYMQFGANPSYQQTGTALHEMNHTMGVGTHHLWYGPSSPLRANGSRGNWLGERANKVVKFFENNNSAVLTGDAVHMWPYGINGAHEDSGSEILYIANGLITQGLCEDGLPPTGGFALPAYTFKSENETKYYIKTEDESRGLYTSYLMENDKGRLIVKEIRKEDVFSNDSAAWYVDFNPKNCYYTIRNVATGKYFSYSTSGTNGIRLINKVPGTNEHFQMMNSRNNIKISYEKESFTTKSYWIIKPEAKLNPFCLGVLSTKSTTAIAFNLGDAATSQRWIFLTEDEVNAFENSNPVINSISYISSENNNIIVDTVKGGIMIRSSFDVRIPIFSIAGEIVSFVNVGSESQFISLANGFYVIDNQKVLVK